MTSTFYDENIIDHYHTRICNEKKFACSFQPFQYEIRLSCPHQMYQDNVIQPALGLLLVEGAPTVGRGKTSWRIGYKNSGISEMNSLSEGNRAVDKILGRMAKIGFLGRKPKKHTLLSSNHVLDMAGKSCVNKKLPFSNR